MYSVKVDDMYDECIFLESAVKQQRDVVWDRSSWRTVISQRHCHFPSSHTHFGLCVWIGSLCFHITDKFCNSLFMFISPRILPSQDVGAKFLIVLNSVLLNKTPVKNTIG